MSLTAQEFQQELRQFHGSEQFYRNGMNRSVIYTEGVKYLADEGGAYWLVDDIAIANMTEAALRGEEFQVWTLTKAEHGQGATLVATDGNEKVLFSEAIAYTDFPLDSITLYFQNNTLLLTSEY